MEIQRGCDSLNLRPGEWPKVRSPEKILATLDKQGHCKSPIRGAYVDISRQVAATAVT